MIKYLSVVLLSLLLLSGALAQEERCNPEMTRYFRDSVQLHLKPTKEIQWYSCESEFGNNLSCCQSGSLRDYMKLNIESQKLRWTNAMRGVNVFDTEVISQAVQIRDKLVAGQSIIAQNTRQGFHAKFVSQETDFLIKYLPIMNKKLFEKRRETYKMQAPSCFNSLANFRKGAMCMVCSPRGHKLFYDGNLLNISYPACNDIVKTCFGTFQFMFMIMGTFDALFDIINAYDPTANFRVSRDPINNECRP